MVRTMQWLAALSIMMLMASALAQDPNQTDNSTQEHNDGDAGEPVDESCEGQYQKDLQQAEDDYEQAKAAEKGDNGTSSENSTASQNTTESPSADEQYQQDMEDAERDYDACKASNGECHIDPEFGDADTTLPTGFPRHYEGDHVSFYLDACGIHGYSVDDAQVFSVISRDFQPVGWERFDVDGATIKIIGVDAYVQISDTPTGVLQYEPFGNDVYFIGMTTVRYTELDGESTDDQLAVRWLSEGIEGRLYVDANVDQGATIAGYEEYPIVATVEDIRTVVVDSPSLDDEETDTALGIADGRIAAEVEFEANGGTRTAEHGDITIRVEFRESDVVATVEGEGDGRTILFNLEKGSFDTLDELIVLFDGEPIDWADDFDDVLDVSDGIAEYLIVVGSERTQILVQVPGFSVHTIAMQGSSIVAADGNDDDYDQPAGGEDVTFNIDRGTPAIGPLAALAAVGAALAVRRRP